MSEYTPGPWTALKAKASRSGDRGPDIAILGPNEELLAEVYNRVQHGSFVDNEANAALIAAAPDLLVALEGLECGGCHLKMTEFYNRPCPDCAPAFAAIAAARGLEAAP